VITEITIPAYSEAGHEITWDLADLREHCTGLIKDGATPAEGALAWIAVTLIDKLQEMSL
jgi:hypothetical protein